MLVEYISRPPCTHREFRGCVLLVFGALAEHVHGGDAALVIEVSDHLDGFFQSARPQCSGWKSSSLQAVV